MTELSLTLKGGKRSTIANKASKIESVSGGRAVFEAELYLPDLPEQGCMFRALTLPRNGVDSVKLTEVEFRIRPPH